MDPKLFLFRKFLWCFYKKVDNVFEEAVDLVSNYLYMDDHTSFDYFSVLGSLSNMLSELPAHQLTHLLSLVPAPKCTPLQSIEAPSTSTATFSGGGGDSAEVGSNVSSDDAIFKKPIWPVTVLTPEFKWARKNRRSKRKYLNHARLV